MFYEDIEDHSPENFYRALGVSKALFSEMLSTLEAVKPRMGRPTRLSLANQLVVCLMYLREYRTQFHRLGQSGTVLAKTAPRGASPRLKQNSTSRASWSERHGLDRAALSWAERHPVGPARLSGLSAFRARPPAYLEGLSVYPQNSSRR